MYNKSLHFHFVGIGGTGMSGLAEILLSLGFVVSGSDLKDSAVCQRLVSRGALISFGHKTENLPKEASLLVYSSAVVADNPELVEARNRGLPIVRRAEVLAELMRLKYGVGVAGSHGKTTTTSMVATVLEHGKLDPTVVIGGVVRSIGSGGKLGAGNYLVAESDESDRSFLLLKPTVAVVTNIDSEHLSAYSSLVDLEQSFAQFVESVPFYGLAVLCIDDARVRSLAKRTARRHVTYGFAPDAMIRAENIQFTRTSTSFDVYNGPDLLIRAELPVLGRHIAQNSLAAFAVGLEFGLSPQVISEALASFEGVKRRLENVGESNGVTILSDYGHHPAEIRATLQAVRSGWGHDFGKLHVVFQPHRYSRTRDCFVDFLECFGDADTVAVTDVYAAGEDPIEGISSQKLVEAMSHQDARYVSSFDEVVVALSQSIKKGDLIVCLGAGSIGGFAEQLSTKLRSKNSGIAVAA